MITASSNNPKNDRIATTREEVSPGFGRRISVVCFGFKDGSGIRIAHSKPSRKYKTPAGAARAAAKWIDQGK